MEDIIVFATEVMALIDARAWVPLAAVLVGAIVRLTKMGPLSERIPPAARPWIALGLGLVSGVLEAVLAGTPAAVAIAGGLISGTLAIAGHDTLVESLRKGKELGAPKVGDK